ncbi:MULTISPECIES: fasciclin domain-containing protein [Nocardia]|uniref:fasciclin domain-containing protein n=1 Tax=Nocardia TaxID=1817 RepID=UPI0018938AF4|nr:MULTISPECIES: fasciclin domain-containing protein [Nocardia]MBF6349463.1 fasciclin domain-containing protein [Nocardia flavorosea]
MKIRKHPAALIAALSAIAIAGSACTDTEESDNAEPSPAMTTSAPTMPAQDDGAMAGPVGAGCADYAEQVPSGPGSIDSMAQEPVATAASNNPLLTTLTSAVSGQLNPQVNLVDTLNSGEFTVFAPVDDAFAALDPATLETLKTDSAMLTSILTYHVVEGRMAPDAVVGTHPTVEGSEVTVTGSGDQLTVNEAAVVCGGVETANATVYLIDGVLTPPTS